MKYLIILIIVTHSFAGSLFWTDIDKIENDFYQVTTYVSDKNESNFNQDINSILDKKFDAFNELLKILKNEPYDLKLPNNYSTKDNDQIRLQKKIETNKSYGYDLAVSRDDIGLSNIILKEKIYEYFITLADEWTSFDKNSLSDLNKKYLEYLSSVKYEKYLDVYNNNKVLDSQINYDISENFIELHKNYMFFNEILIYIESNKKILAYESLTSFLKINSMIDAINSNIYIAKINTYLRFIYTDMGKLIIFFISMFVFFILNYFIYKIIYKYIITTIGKSHNEIDENILENLEKMSRPISLIVVLIGLKLSIEILIYPSLIAEQLEYFFNFIYLSIVTYIIYIIIDIFSFSYLVKNEKKTEEIRRELIIFLISISKVVIFFIIFLLFLINMEINISAFIASLGIGGLAIALAAQTTLSNFFGLLKIIFDNSFSQGDWIETNEVEGHVVDVSFISTTIRTFDNAMITIPNSTLANASIKNWSKRKVGRRIKMHIGVTYSSSMKNVKNAIKEIEEMLINHEGISTLNEIDYDKIHKNYKKEQRFVSINDKYGVKSSLFVYLDQLSDSSMDILIYTFTKTTNWQEWLKIKQDVIFNIWNILEKNNLEFAFPSQSIYLKENTKSN